jgi:hypothetical protein
MQTHITQLETPARELFLSKALLTRVLAVQGTYKYDLDGALDAGQHGMAFVSARSAFHATLFIHLARRGQSSALVTRNASPDIFALLEACDGDGDILREAWRMERLNPTTPEDVRAYVEEYRRLFRDVFHFDELPAVGSLHTDAGYDVYLEHEAELSDVFQHLGLDGINLPDARQRTARRALVKKRLREDSPDVYAQEEDAPVQPGPGAPSQASAPVTVVLSDDEARALEGLLRDQVEILKQDVSRTDGRDVRRALITRREVCERVLPQLAAGAASAS